MIQDGSIGRGVRLTTRLVVSIIERDISSPQNGNFENRPRRKDERSPAKVDAKLITIP